MLSDATAHAALFALLIVTAGCVSSGPVASPTPTTSPTATDSPTASPTPTSPPTPGPPTTLPPVEPCLTETAPQPGSVDGLNASAYPSRPETVNRSTAAAFVTSFEESYTRNDLIQRESGDEDMNLTEVTVYARTENASRVADGYVVVVGVFAATKYESGIHGDHWLTAAYFVNETTMLRQQIDSKADAAPREEGTPVLHCAAK